MKREPLSVASVQTDGGEMRVFVLADACEFMNSFAFSSTLIPKSKRKACIPVKYFAKPERRGCRRLGQEVFLHGVSYLTDAVFGI
jgi:hypothetical protein